jgi:hypothetical protein
VDTDGDGTPDAKDNCPSIYNPYQTDKDGDRIGDACDLLKSCKEILTLTKDVKPLPTDGIYKIDPDGDVGPIAPVDVYCDMTKDGGGWTFILKMWYGAPSIFRVKGAVGIVNDALSKKGASYKLDDDVIRSIIGVSENFDILADQAGYNSYYSNGNYEYVIVRNYTGRWTYEAVVETSRTKTTFQSYRLSDNALAWTGDLKCGTAGGAHASGAGINCVNVIENNPQGGAGCNINMGKYSNSGWHHFYMSEHNTDTYLYICNGAQHSSSYDLNHRFWVREY